jgi:hypothetical protein
MGRYILYRVMDQVPLLPVALSKYRDVRDSRFEYIQLPFYFAGRASLHDAWCSLYVLLYRNVRPADISGFQTEVQLWNLLRTGLDWPGAGMKTGASGSSKDGNLVAICNLS